MHVEGGNTLYEHYSDHLHKPYLLHGLVIQSYQVLLTPIVLVTTTTWPRMFQPTKQGHSEEKVLKM